MKGLFDLWWIFPLRSFPFSNCNSAKAAFALGCYLLLSNNSFNTRWVIGCWLTPNTASSSSVSRAACTNHFRSSTGEQRRCYCMAQELDSHLLHAWKWNSDHAKSECTAPHKKPVHSQVNWCEGIVLWRPEKPTQCWGTFQKELLL